MFVFVPASAAEAAVEAPVEAGRSSILPGNMVKGGRGAVSLHLFLHRRNRSFTTPVEQSTPRPIWSTKHIFSGVECDEAAAGQLEVSLWNFSHSVKHECLGEWEKQFECCCRKKKELFWGHRPPACVASGKESLPFSPPRKRSEMFLVFSGEALATCAFLSFLFLSESDMSVPRMAPTSRHLDPRRQSELCVFAAGLDYLARYGSTHSPPQDTRNERMCNTI